MITTINEFKNNKLKSNIIDIKKLEEYAKALEIICNNEYGYIYFNPNNNSIFVCLGDANPFDIEYLSGFILNAISKTYKTEDQINIEIDMECGPNNNEEGWLLFKNNKWQKIN
jgi:hypothetical protein